MPRQGASFLHSVLYFIPMNKKKYRPRTYEQIIKAFERQEKRDEYYELDKRLFTASQYLSLDDWREIRKGEYWDTMDKMKASIDDIIKVSNLPYGIAQEIYEKKDYLYWRVIDIKRKSYTLRKVNQYVKRNNL